MIAELPRLTDAERALVAKALHELTEVKGAVESPQIEPTRRAGMHPGAMVASDDFDDPLPDSFWLGEDA